MLHTRVMDNSTYLARWELACRFIMYVVNLDTAAYVVGCTE